jgi:CRISPR system Cascade subunit CasE
MYLSKITIDTSSLLAARERNIYKQHQFVMSAFPDNLSDKDDILHYTQDHIILVQSNLEPNWTEAATHHPYILNAQVKTFSPVFTKGQKIRFKILTNPTMTKNGKPRFITEEKQQVEWMFRKAEQNGFEIDGVSVVRSAWYKAKDKRQNNIVIGGATFTGVLSVCDITKIHEAIRKGIGRAKRFGFGMLMVAL